MKDLMKGAYKTTAVAAASSTLFFGVFAGINAVQASASSSSVTISFWGNSFTQPAVKVFEQQYPNIKVQFTLLGGNNYKQAVRLAADAHKLPDAYVTDGGYTFLSYVNAHDALDLTTDAKADHWSSFMVKDYLNSVTQNGHVYGAPYDLVYDWGAFFYNQTFFKQYNIPIPKTMTQLVQVAKDIKAHGMAPLALGDKDGWPADLLFGDLLLEQANPKLVDQLNSGAVKWTNSPEVRKAMNTILSLTKEGVFAPGYLTSDANTAIMEWAGKKTAMLYNGQWWPGVTGTFNLGFNIGAMPLPSQGQTYSPPKGAQAWSNVVVVGNPATKHKAAVLKLLNFLVGEKDMMYQAKLNKAYTPNQVVNNKLQHSNFLPSYFTAPVFSYQEKIPKMVYFDHAFPDSVELVLQQNIQQLMQGTVSLNTLLQNVEKAQQAAIKGTSN